MGPTSIHGSLLISLFDTPKAQEERSCPLRGGWSPMEKKLQMGLETVPPLSRGDDPSEEQPGPGIAALQQVYISIRPLRHKY